MTQMYLYVEAPFAAFRTFTAGWYRPTATFLTPSAAYGLVLNIAGIESRLREGDDGHDGRVPTTLTRSDLPAVQIATGIPAVEVAGRQKGTAIPEDDLFPRLQSVYQQLHNYPVGASGKERAESCQGNKYNITPVRRELLSDVRAIIAIRAHDDLIVRVRRGLSGELNDRRYGVPFLGDNAFLLDRLFEVSDPCPTHWYHRIDESSASGVKDRVTRLTEVIDRADLSRTRSALFAPDKSCSDAPPESAWASISGTPPADA